MSSKQRLATYTNLDARKYVFRVQGSNSDGVWNHEGVSLPILITPPRWETNAFRALFAAFVVTLLLGAYQLRVRQLRRQYNIRWRNVWTSGRVSHASYTTLYCRRFRYSGYRRSGHRRGPASSAGSPLNSRPVFMNHGYTATPVHKRASRR